MPRSITQRELRNDSGEIMRRLDAGETFIVTRRGVPVGELVPVRPRRFARCELIAEVFSHAVPIDADRFRADLERFVDHTATPRG